MTMTKVPSFDHPEEERQFWGSTDLTDVDSEEVEVERADRPLSATFALRLDQDSVESLRHIARQRGIGVTQLARSWILDRLRLERAAGELANPEADEVELRARRAVMEDVGSRLPDLVAAAVVAAGLGNAAGKKFAQAKRKGQTQELGSRKQASRRAGTDRRSGKEAGGGSK